jgi:hypothetical protein
MPLSAFVAVGASVALAACGSSGGGGSTGASASTTTSGSGSQQTASLDKFRSCLKDNGVTLPNGGQGGPGGGGNGSGPPAGGTGTNGAPGGGAPGGGAPGAGPGGANGGKFGKAMQACAKYRPQGAQGGPGGGAGGYGQQGPRQNVQAFTPYLNCLKSAGLDVKVSDGFNALRNLKQDDPKVQAAFKSCQSKLPQRPQRQNGGTSTNGTT